MNDNPVSKSFFCVLNNPEEHGYSGEPHEIAEKIADDWCKDNPSRTCAVAYCLSAEGLPHCHLVLEDIKAMRFSAIKKLFPSMHIEPTKGTKEQAENYIQKKGPFEEKGEQVLYIARRGEIKASQGSRKDLEVIAELIEQGRTPNEIMDMSLSYRRYEKMIKDAFYRKRFKETPSVRSVKVIWHFGEPGSGKTYTYKQLVDEYGEDNVYFITDYENGGFDFYNGQAILCLDEFRGQFKFSFLLNILNVYKSQIHCRYSNCFSLWNEVHIFSVLPPEKVYEKMVSENREIDNFGQLLRRLDFLVYHWKDGKGYHKFELSKEKYVDYEDLKLRALFPENYRAPIEPHIVDEVEVPF